MCPRPRSRSAVLRRRRSGPWRREVASPQRIGAARRATGRPPGAAWRRLWTAPTTVTGPRVRAPADAIGRSADASSPGSVAAASRRRVGTTAGARAPHRWLDRRRRGRGRVAEARACCRVAPTPESPRDRRRSRLGVGRCPRISAAPTRPAPARGADRRAARWRSRSFDARRERRREPSRAFQVRRRRRRRIAEDAQTRSGSAAAAIAVGLEDPPRARRAVGRLAGGDAPRARRCRGAPRRGQTAGRCRARHASTSRCRPAPVRRVRPTVTVPGRRPSTLGARAQTDGARSARSRPSRRPGPRPAARARQRGPLASAVRSQHACQATHPSASDRPRTSASAAPPPAKATDRAPRCGGAGQSRGRVDQACGEHCTPPRAEHLEVQQHLADGQRRRTRPGSSRTRAPARSRRGPAARGRPRRARRRRASGR